MIAKLTGTICGKSVAAAILDVHGVGYEVRLAPSFLFSLTDGAKISLYTHAYIREDSHDLYGFATHEERDFFRVLISISGVGPRIALNILNLGSVAELKEAISRGDVAYLTTVSGIGKKTAERVIVELKGKVGVEKTAFSGSLADVAAALADMGYAGEDIRAALRELPRDDRASGELLKEALRRLRSYE